MYLCKKNREILDTRKHIAVEKLENGTHNCAQAIICTYADLIGIDEETGRNLGNAFGSGMGNMEGTCGALVAAEMLLGLKRYEGKSLLKQARAVSEMFKLYTGATLCKDIKGRDTGKVLCSCEDCVRNAVTICESGLYEK